MIENLTFLYFMTLLLAAATGFVFAVLLRHEGRPRAAHVRSRARFHDPAPCAIPAGSLEEAGWPMSSPLPTPASSGTKSASGTSAGTRALHHPVPSACSRYCARPRGGFHGPSR